MSEVGRALETYYSIKSAYDKKYSSQKNKILKNAKLTDVEKREKIAQIKIGCVKCKRKVGMVFSRNKRTVQIRCGDRAKPCALDLKIYLGVYQELGEEITRVKNKLESAKVDIIKSKLDVLFRLADEDKTLASFQKQKKVYASIEEELLKLERQKDPHFQLALRADQARALIYEFHEKIALLKGMLRQYVEEDQQSLLREAIIMYQEEMVPLQEAIRKANYTLVEVEETEGVQSKHFRLIQERKTLREMELVIKPAKVASFKI